MKFKADFKDFEKFTEKIKKIAEQDIEKVSQKYCEETVKELVARLFAKVVEKTPVGEYGPKEVHFITKEGKEVNFIANSHKTGGTLKRGWTAGDVVKRGNVYEIELVNPTHYASYVEYGHRTPPRSDGSRGWVEGRFMLTLSEEELKQEAPEIIEHKFEKFLEDYLNGNN